MVSNRALSRSLYRAVTQVGFRDAENSTVAGSAAEPPSERGQSRNSSVLAISQGAYRNSAAFQSNLTLGKLTNSGGTRGTTRKAHPTPGLAISFRAALKSAANASRNGDKPQVQLRERYE
jgi:hypothetical protein